MRAVSGRGTACGFQVESTHSLLTWRVACLLLRWGDGPARWIVSRQRRGDTSPSRSRRTNRGHMGSATVAASADRMVPGARSLTFQAARRIGVRAHASLIRQIRGDVATKRCTALETTEQCLAQLKQDELLIRAFISVHPEKAREQARQVDAAVQRGEGVGPLAGVPIAVKDNICTRDMQTTAGSKVLEGYVPPYDATVVRKLREAGAVIVGKTNMDEFGMGSSTEASAFHPTKNPRSTGRVPGGSSGGSAAAVAASFVPAALGSDTGGSIRQPASFCGVVGIKPTYGLVSRHGLIAYASSLDTIGPMARTVEDAALLLDVIAGSDPYDATSASGSRSPGLAAACRKAEELSSQPLQGMRFGLVTETMGEGVDEGVQDAIRKAAEHFESLGASVEEVSLPTFAMGLPAYYVIASSEASSNLARYDGVRYGLRTDAADLAQMYGATRSDGLGAEVKRRILMGTYALSAGYYDAYYKRAQQVRTLVQREMESSLGTFDALLMPSAPTVAYKSGEKTADPLAMYKGDVMTVNVNLAGLPAISVPCGFVDCPGESEPLPVGLQIVGRAFGEAAIVGIADAYQKTATFAYDSLLR